ncbi:MAG: vitamin K epoxide reductase family protein [Bacteroidota bacterium]
MEDSLFALLKKFIEKQNYRINLKELKFQLLSHPSYPSLHSVTGILNHFNMDNVALEVPKDRETLVQLPETFLSITTAKQYILVFRYEHHVQLLFNAKEKKNISIDEFLHTWSGIVVAMEKADIQTDKRGMLRSISLKPLYAFTIVLIIGLFFYYSPSLFAGLHFTFSLVGIFISVLIVRHELGYNSKAVDKFCTSNEYTNCDAVLNSGGASLSKYVKLSDICVVYFMGISLYWILFSALSLESSIIPILAILGIPVTLYSLYYQARIVKKWCPLCLGIVGVLWLQFFSLSAVGFSVIGLALDTINLFILFLSILVITSVWFLLRPLLKERKELKELQISHHKFIRNFDLFNAMLSQAESIETSIPQLHGKEIILGNTNAPLSLLIITNPSCFYCKAAHSDLEKIVTKNPTEINVTIRFSVRTDNQGDLAYRVTNRLLELYHTTSKERYSLSLNEAYAAKADLKKWLKKWGDVTTNVYAKTLQIQKEWCLENNINFTPALYINGRPFPKEYDRENLSYFIDDLIDQLHMELEQNENLEIA